jgi:hypothetical protein
MVEKPNVIRTSQAISKHTPPRGEDTHIILTLQYVTHHTISPEITDRLTWKYLGSVFDFESPFL